MATKDPSPPAQDKKKAALNQALRANLLKRKAQAKAQDQRETPSEKAPPKG